MACSLSGIMAAVGWARGGNDNIADLLNRQELARIQGRQDPTLQSPSAPRSEADELNHQELLRILADRPPPGAGDVRRAPTQQDLAARPEGTFLAGTVARSSDELRAAPNLPPPSVRDRAPPTGAPSPTEVQAPDLTPSDGRSTRRRPPPTVVETPSTAGASGRTNGPTPTPPASTSAPTSAPPPAAPPPASSSAAARPPADENERELIDKIKGLMGGHPEFRGSYRAAFGSYAHDNGAMNRDDLRQFLSDAGVGSGLTRGYWIDGILERLDANHNQKLDWGEISPLLG
jgi:hypothetical protein